MTLSNPSVRLRNRRGSAYVLVLGLVVIMVLSGAAALTVARARTGVLVGANDCIVAEALAESAVERALTLLNADRNWRTSYRSGIATTPLPFGGGTVSFRLVDEEDNDLDNNPEGAIRIYGIGRAGRATRVYSTQARGKEALSSAQAAASVGGDITLSGSAITTDYKIASNRDILATSASIVDGDLEASRSIIGTITGTGARVQGAARRWFPDANTVFDYYIENGTAIPIETIPTSGANKQIQSRLFSPASNPFGGATNPQGIYVIDCEGWNLQLSACRVVGTLVILDPGINSAIQTAQYWTPAVANFPIFLVRGDFTIESTTTALVDDAGSIPPVNYNPPGTPYSGITPSTDDTYTTVYPVGLMGLIYISGDLTTMNGPTIKGALIVDGSYLVQGSLYLTYDSTLVYNPPPGFTGSGQIFPVAHTWRMEEAP